MKKRRSITDEEAQGARIDAMRASERRMLEEARGLEACDCKEGMFPNPGRRRVLLAAGTGLAAAAAGFLPIAARAHEASTDGDWTDMPDDPTKVPGRPIGVNDGYGVRSHFETELRGLSETPSNLTAWSMTPLDKSLGVVTPSGLHFERYRNGIPTIDPARHTLTVHGMVDQPAALFHGRPQALPVRIKVPFHRMQRQHVERMARADHEDCAVHPWSSQHVGVDRRTVFPHRERGGV